MQSLGCYRVAALRAPTRFGLRIAASWFGVFALAFGACLGGTFALVGCRLAIERAEAAERNRDLFRALDLRISRVTRDSNSFHN